MVEHFLCLHGSWPSLKDTEGRMILNPMTKDGIYGHTILGLSASSDECYKWKVLCIDKISREVNVRRKALENCHYTSRMEKFMNEYCKRQFVTRIVWIEQKTDIDSRIKQNESCLLQNITTNWTKINVKVTLLQLYSEGIIKSLVV